MGLGLSPRVDQSQGVRPAGLRTVPIGIPEKASPDFSDKGLGPNQLGWCITHADECPGGVSSVRHAKAKAAELAERYGWSDDLMNAFLHAYWMGINVLEMDPGDAETLGIAHEYDRNDGWDDTVRDLSNNKLGIFIGRHSSSREEVEEALIILISLGGQLTCASGGIHPCAAAPPPP